MAAYLDNASSEPLAPVARETLQAALDTGWADPLRLHAEARRARLLLDNARAVAAESLGVRADEVTFTASGTDAVHRGLLGLLRGARGQGRPPAVALSAVEHSAVFAAAHWWSEHSPDTREVLVSPVDPEGRVREDELARLAQESAVVAVQQGNPEVGTLQPLPTVAALTRAQGVPLFVDACACAALEPLPHEWDAAALSAHKWGGPPGVGVLLVRKGRPWRAPFPSDDRTDPRTSGYENVPGALAAAAALQARVAERERLSQRYRGLGARLVAGLAGIPDVDVHGPDVVAQASQRLPHLVSASFLYLDGETLVHELDRAGLQVASGSACTSSSLEPSHVLVAMGGLTHGNLRVSFGPTTEEADVDRLVAALHDVVPRLREGVR